MSVINPYHFRLRLLFNMAGKKFGWKKVGEGFFFVKNLFSVAVLLVFPVLS
jgi:hypothetical protein